MSASAGPRLLALHARLGPWLFSKLICLKAPYFTSIAPRVAELAVGRCVALMRHRRRVTNHLGTVHAIALCNLAELTAGLVTDVSLPPEMRWIPKGMRVEYLRKAVGTIRATATPREAPGSAPAGYALAVDVEASDDSGEAVFRAEVTMWISPRRG